MAKYGHRPRPCRTPPLHAPFPAVTRDSIAPSLSHALGVPVSPALQTLSSVLQLLAPHSHQQLLPALACTIPWAGLTVKCVSSILDLVLRNLSFSFHSHLLIYIWRFYWQLNSAFHNGLILLSSTCFSLKRKKFNWFQGDHIILVF